MTQKKTVFDLIEVLKKKAPEYLDLLTAKTNEEFEDAFIPVLEKAVEQLESNKSLYRSLSEDGLSSVLVGNLSLPGLTVTRETHSNGHVDITISADHCVPARKKLAEAKIFNGPEYHIKGLKQLLSRYTTGRESNGLLIAYVRKKEIATLIRKIREQMDHLLPEDQIGETDDYILKWSFSSKHRHTCGDDLQVDHIGCNLDCSD